MLLQAVLFDMDGVICDNMPLHRQVWKQFADERGVTLSAAEWRKMDGRRAADIVATVFGVVETAENQALTEAREALYREVLRTAKLRPVPGVEACLNWLTARGIPCVLATSATAENVQQVLGGLNLTHHFRATVTAADVQQGKPHPEVYLKAAARAGVQPQDCLVVEDAVPGVLAGRAAGAHCLGLTTSEPASALQAAGAHWVAPDLRFFTSDTMPDGSRLAGWFGSPEPVESAGTGGLRAPLG